jgi:hypothetical protein
VGQLGEQADNIGGTESKSVSTQYKWECSTCGGWGGPREITRGSRGARSSCSSIPLKSVTHNGLVFVLGQYDGNGDIILKANY